MESGATRWILLTRLQSRIKLDCEKVLASVYNITGHVYAIAVHFLLC